MRRIAVLLTLLTLVPAAAQASTVGDLFGTTFDDTSGNETNVVNVNIGGSDGKIHFTDNAGITPQGDCANEGGVKSAFCPMVDAPFILARLKGGNDTFSADVSLRLLLDSGPGNDIVTGGSGDDILSGNAGNDTVTGGNGDDLITDKSAGIFADNPVSQGADTESGGNGDDTIIAGPGADTIDGGPDFDTVDYSARTTATFVSVDAGGANDGGTGEGDEVKNIDVILGGSGPDTFTAGGGGSRLVGNGGDDVLTGGPGGDLLNGGDDAGSGNDTLDGRGGADELRGGDGTDTVTYASRTNPVTVSPDDIADDGEAGEGDNVRSDVEHFVGGSGGDVFKLRDGRVQTVDCGAGADSVVADAYDTVGADCETVDQPTSGGGTGGGGTGGGGGGGSSGGTGTVPSVVAFGGGKLKVDRRRRIALKLICSAGGGCAGRLEVRRGKKRVGAATYIVAAAKLRTIRIVLPRRIVRTGGKLAVRCRATIGTGPPTDIAITLPKAHG